MPGAKILVVDDEEINLDLSTHFLEESGFSVSRVNSGRAALEAIGHRDFDLVLLDQKMPEMSGLDVVRHLRSSPAAGRLAGKSLAIIMVTAVTDSARIVEALDAGADDYITKPVDYKVALARIRIHLHRRQTVAELQRSEERFALAAQGAEEALWEWDFETGLVFYSDEWKRLLGLEGVELGTDPSEWLNRIHPQERAAFQKSLDAHLGGETHTLQCEQRLKARDSSYHWMAVRAMCSRDRNGKALRLAGKITDITARATRDAVTGLPNQALFVERLEKLLGERSAEADIGVLLLNLDRFKIVNDSLGRAAGDQMLLAVSERLNATLRHGDHGSALARLEGDSFAVLAKLNLATSSKNNGGEARKSAEALAARLLESLSTPILVDGREVFATASIGIALASEVAGNADGPSDGGPPAPDDLLGAADIALDMAKKRGKGRWVVFDAAMREAPRKHLLVESELHRAILNREFVVYYQPRVRLSDGGICGFEALVRWNHPQRGMVPPNDFIPIAEETGLILQIGQFVLREACRQMRAWQVEFASGPRLDIAVNLSVCQCREATIVSQVAQVLRETGLAPECLHLELTETVLLDDFEQGRAVLTQLKALGVGLKLDDFGTGYSCLRYLGELPFDALKIDRSFTMALDRNKPASGAMVRTILALAHGLNLAVIAEGIEKLEHIAELRRLGCEFGQGYYFSKPVSAADIGGLMRHLREHSTQAEAAPAKATLLRDKLLSLSSATLPPLEAWDAWNRREARQRSG